MLKSIVLFQAFLFFAFVGFAQTGALYGLNFNGTSDDVTIKDHSSLNPKDEISVEAWIKPESFAKNIYENSVFCKHGWASGNAGYVLRCGAAGQASFNVSSSSGSWMEAQSDTNVLKTNEWNHIMGTFDGDTVAIYVNGILVGFKLYSGAITPSTGLAAKIGELANGTGRNFDGDIDEVRVWNKAIDQETMRTWMCRKVTPGHPYYKNLVAYYKLDEGTGSSISDYSKQSNNGSISGAYWANSGAALGDTSVVDYNYHGRLTLASAKGDSLTVRLARGYYTGLHLYMLKGKTQITTVKGATAKVSEDNSWGVFVAQPFFTKLAIKYDYSALKISGKDECFLDLFSRQNRAARIWQMDSTNLHTAGDSITIDSTARWGEYIFGNYGNKTLSTSTGDSVFCLGDTFSLFAPGNSSFAYQWYKDGKKISGATARRYSTTTDGKFYCEITRGKTCSYNSNTMTVSGVKKATVSLGSFKGVCVDVDTVFLSGGLPKGGYYSGTGVTDSFFFPSKQKAGTYQINYSYKNSAGCVSTATKSIDVWRLPNVAIKSGLKICDNLDTVSLSTGSPKGGVYSGSGISKNIFHLDSISRKLGNYNYNYSYTDINGCSNSASNSLKVVYSTPITFTPFDTLCENDQAVKIKVNPNQGTYTGNGVKSRDFYPSIAGAGSHIISFEFKNIDGCITSASQSAVVKSVTKASFTGSSTFCENGDTTTLKLASPKGGRYEGTAITANVFNPKVAGGGLHAISYFFTNKDGCTDTAKGSITVNDTADLTITKLNPFCYNEKASELKNVSPAGGDYSGNGISKNYFTAKTAGSGTHNVNYVYKTVDGCISKTSFSIEVYEKRDISFDVNNSFCSNADSIALITTKPKGGAHYGLGVRNEFLVPAKAGVGKWWLVYKQTDANNCLNKDSIEIEILETPIVSLAKMPSLCDYENEISLNGGSPLGGNYFVNGSETQKFNPKSSGAGVYKLVYVVTGSNGCVDSKESSFNVNAAPAKPTITKTENNLTSSANTGNQWYSSAGILTNETNKTFNPSASGIYYVVVTNDSLCSARSDDFDFASSIQDLARVGIKLYPNPSSGILFLQYNSYVEIANVVLYSVEGKEVMNRNYQVNPASLDLTMVQTGVYFLQITTADNKLYFQKIVLNKN